MEYYLNHVIDYFLSSPYSEIKDSLENKKLLTADLLIKYGVQKIMDIFPEAKTCSLWEQNTPKKLVENGIFDERLQFVLQFQTDSNEWFDLGEFDFPSTYTGIWTRTCGSNSIVEKFHVVCGMEHGSYKAYDEGKIFLSCNYNNGKLHGRYELWHSNGKPFLLGFYKNGLLHGLYRTWYNNGATNQVSVFMNGEIVGTSEKWDKDGSLIKTEKFSKKIVISI